MTTPAYMTGAISVTESHPKFHCLHSHTDGEGSIVLTEHPATFYLYGTPEQIREWADLVTQATYDWPEP